MAVGAVLTTATLGPAGPGSASTREGDNAFRQVNLVSDLPNRARLLDREVKNPRGIALGPNTPLWVSNNFNPASLVCGSCSTEDLLTKITLYRGANGVEPIKKVDLEVAASAPMGVVFNPTSSFVVKQGNIKAPARFLFNELVGNDAGTGPLAKITGWSNASSPPPKTTANTRAKKNFAVHTGLALVPGGSNASGRGNSQPILLAADNDNNTIDVFNRAFKRLKMPRAFVDPGARGRAARMKVHNVAFLQGRVYVTYAEGRSSAVSVFTRDGRFIKRLVTCGPLAGPWAMTIAPEHWGKFGGALLVGNLDDGKINAFNRRNGHHLGTISDAHGKPLVNPGLWGLTFGNGTIGTANTLLFAAGIGSGEGGAGPAGQRQHGLVGLIKPVGR